MAIVMISGFTDEEAEEFSTWLKDSGVLSADEWFEINHNLGLITSKGFMVKKVINIDTSLIEIQVKSIKETTSGDDNVE